MRWGWLAAAAAMMCASQAEAARYYEFELFGVAQVTYYDPFGVRAPFVYNRASRFTVAFDTAAAPSFNGYMATGVPEVATFFSTSGRLDTLNSPGGTFFDLAFAMGDIAASSVLQRLTVSGSYGYHDCDNRYRYCTSSPTTLMSMSARTSDGAPAFLGEREDTLITPVPEATTWGMMILGMAAIGRALRRRRVLRMAGNR